MSAATPAGDHAFELRQLPGDFWQFATLVYREGARTLEVDLECSGVPGSDWLAADSAFCHWNVPAGVALEPEHTDRVLARLAAWSERSGVRLDIVPAVDPLVAFAAEGYALTRNADGSVTAIPPAKRARGFLAVLFGK